MRIQPRKQILDVWRALLRACHGPGGWSWGSEDEPNSVSDAEQLLCLLYPANEIEEFALHDAHLIKDDVAYVLRPLANGVNRIPRAVIDICAGYFERHTDAAGQPRFGSAAYLHSLESGGPGATSEQNAVIEVTDSYAISVTLCLEVLVFARMRVPLEPSAEYSRKLAVLQEQASRRLTAAMVGLLRGFVVNAVDRESDAGLTVRRLLEGADYSGESLSRFQERFGHVRAQLLSDVRLGVPETSKPEYDQLFECGWSWGIAEDSEQVDFVEFLEVATAYGMAPTRPYLYFTVVALDSMADLFSRRTRGLDVFDEVQARLVEALQVRWDLTQRYWSTIARYDKDRWPLEDMPWRSSDGEESDYFTLLVTSVLLDDLADRRAAEGDVAKAIGILEELASRGRVTRRMLWSDDAARMHWPGLSFRLVGSDKLGPLLAWRAYDFTPLLLKRCCEAVRLTGNPSEREGLMRVAEAAMDQLALRCLTSGPAAGLWDDASRIAPGGFLQPDEKPSWYFTKRVVDALVSAAAAYAEGPPRSDVTYDLLIVLLCEADQLYNQELMFTDTRDSSRRREGLDVIGMLIGQARSLSRTQSGTAVALASQALLELNRLGAARLDAMRGY